MIDVRKNVLKGKGQISSIPLRDLTIVTSVLALKMNMQVHHVYPVMSIAKMIAKDITMMT